MRWRRGRTSRDIEDRRGRRGFGAPAAIGGLGVPGLIIFLVLTLLGGGGLGDVVTDLEGGGPPPGTSTPTAEDQRLVDFLSFVLDDVQGSWERSFDASGKNYERARLVLFDHSTGSGCGGATSNIGPHYCPPDQTVYIDLDFFRALKRQFGAPGDFAQAYVLAHEIAHHVQNVLGISDEVRAEQRRDPDRANELSVLLELQADCLAGVWGNTAADRKLLEPGDLEEGLAAAAAVGDDRIQEQAGQDVDRESWTHGSSEQRVSWFRRGFDSGDPAECDTFS